MNLVTVIIMSAALAMDAFAVSICKGLATKHADGKVMLACALWFGLLQGLMPALGYFFGAMIVGAVQSFSSWIAFGLLAFIGINMIRESGKEEDTDSSIETGEMFMLAIATSIDALAVGVSFSMTPVEIVAAWPVWANAMLACVIIAIVTGIFCAFGVWLGSVAGSHFQKKAKIAGGLVLILIGIHILLSSYGIL